MRVFLIRLTFLPTLLWNLVLHRLDRRRRWWDRVDEHVILGALPFASDVPALKAEGVRAAVNACLEYPGPLAAYQRAGITQLHLPAADFTPLPLEDLERGVAFMRAQRERGATVYVHCKAGRGRGAMLALCWLIAERGLTPEEAQARLLEKRPHVVRDLYLRKEVLEFARRHGKPELGATGTQGGGSS